MWISTLQTSVNGFRYSKLHFMLIPNTTQSLFMGSNTPNSLYVDHIPKDLICILILQNPPKWASRLQSLYVCTLSLQCLPMRTAATLNPSLYGFQAHSNLYKWDPILQNLFMWTSRLANTLNYLQPPPNLFHVDSSSSCPFLWLAMP